MECGSKPWYKSRTVWANICIAGIALAQLLDSQKMLPVAVMPWVPLVSGVLNIALRFITSTSIGGGDKTIQEDAQ